MKICLLVFNIAAALLIIILTGSCTDKHALKLAGRFENNDAAPAYKKFLVTDRKKRNHTVPVSRFLLKGKMAATSKLNDQAIEELEKGNLIESEILLKTAEKYEPADSSVKNNLAVIFELTGKDNLALKNYMEALQISPKDLTIKRNFILFSYKPEKIKLYFP